MIVLSVKAPEVESRRWQPIREGVRLRAFSHSRSVLLAKSSLHLCFWAFSAFFFHQPSLWLSGQIDSRRESRGGDPPWVLTGRDMHPTSTASWGWIGRINRNFSVYSRFRVIKPTSQSAQREREQSLESSFSLVVSRLSASV